MIRTRVYQSIVKSYNYTIFPTCRSSEPGACYTIHIGRLVTCESGLKCLFGLNSLHKFRDFCWFFAAELMRGGGGIERGKGVRMKR